MKSDFWGYFFSHCRWIYYNTNRFYYSITTRTLLSLKKIKIGKLSVFYGRPHFQRFPESTINIGKNCIFDSTKFRNLIGVNKCCTISTMTKEAKLYIGNSTGFSGVKISCFERIEIGDNCLVGANVLITDSDWHAIDPTKRKDANSIKTKPIKIGNNVFIGVNSIILKGSEIGDNSVVGAGSVVSGIIPPNIIVAGNPCKKIKNV